MTAMITMPILTERLTGHNLLIRVVHKRPTEVAARHASQSLTTKYAVQDGESEHDNEIQYARNDHAVISG